MAFSKRDSVAYDIERTFRTLFKRCVKCPGTQPSCPPCSGNDICSLVPEDCNTCAHMVCIANPSPAPPSKGPNVGAIAGGVIGGVAFVAIIVFLIWRFWIKKRREQQDRELEEEWENDDIAQQKASQQFQSMQTDAASTRTRGSLANSILSRASNIIQIAYIPGVTNRNGSGHNSLLAPVPPIPAAHRNQPPKSPLSNQGDALFFRPGDLRDSTYSGNSSLSEPGNRDTRYTMKSITPSLARSSMASELYQDDQNTPPMPATTVIRAAPRMVSVKSSSTTSPAGTPTEESGSTSPATAGKGKGVQVMMPGQGDNSSLKSSGSQYGKAKQVTVGGKGRFPVRMASDASSATSTATAKHTPAVSSPLAEQNEDTEDDDEEDEHARARRSLINTAKEAYETPPAVQPVESPFFDATERPAAAAVAASSSTRPNPYASMGSTIATSTGSSPKRNGKGMGGLSAVIEEATRRASRVPSHEGLGGKRDTSPFSDAHATE